MKRVQSKITLTYILLAAGVVVAVGAISSFEIESYFKNRLVNELNKQADMVLFSLQQDSTNSFAQFDQRLKHLAQLGNIRITLIDRNGKVLDDSDVPASELPHVENHLQRPEVQEALKKGIGAATRHSATVGKDFMYVAKRVESGVSAGLLKGITFVRLSIHLEELQKNVDEIRFKIFLAGVIVLLLVFGVSAFVSAEFLNR